MTGPVITFSLDPTPRHESRLTRSVPPPDAPTMPPDTGPRATPVAKLLALAHHIERQVENGDLKDYADAARQLGMAKSHMTHVMNLLRLAPNIQAEIIEGTHDLAERRFRPLSGLMAWEEQRRALAELISAD